MKLCKQNVSPVLYLIRFISETLLIQERMIMMCSFLLGWTELLKSSVYVNCSINAIDNNCENEVWNTLSYEAE